MTTLKPRAGMRLTVDEFMELPDTDDRKTLELDKGALYIAPRPKLVHGFLLLRLAIPIDQYLDSFDVLPGELMTKFIVALSLEGRVLLAPDLSIVLRSNPATITDRMVEGAPDIVVEILSSDRSRDLVRKRRLYAEAGVPEYWLIDPTNDTATVLELRDGDYVQRAVLVADDILTTPLLPGLAIPLADVFRHRMRPA